MTNWGALFSISMQFLQLANILFRRHVPWSPREAVNFSFLSVVLFFKTFPRVLMFVCPFAKR